MRYQYLQNMKCYLHITAVICDMETHIYVSVDDILISINISAA